MDIGRASLEDTSEMQCRRVLAGLARTTAAESTQLIISTMLPSAWLKRVLSRSFRALV